MEKVRLTLWDVFTFFLVGAYVGICLVAVSLLREPQYLLDMVPQIINGSSILTTAGIGVCLILVGMLVEPFANYFDRYLLNRIPRRLRIDRAKVSPDDAAIREFAANRLLAPLNLDLQNPYYVIKDFVEQEQAAPTVMIFLSRFGFYRSVAYVTFMSSLVLAASATRWIESVAEVILGIGTALLFKARSDEFYSYIAPAVYRGACARFIERFRLDDSPHCADGGIADE